MTTFGFIVPESVKETFGDFSLIHHPSSLWFFIKGTVKDGDAMDELKHIKVEHHLKELLGRELTEEENMSLEYYSDNNNWHFWPGKVFRLHEDYSTLEQLLVGL